MKKLVTILAAVLLTASVFAQAPQKMSYQAVVRNSSDQLVVNTQIGMQISILQGSATGTPVYVETQTPTTNANGLISIIIGSGTIVTGTFAGIDWSAGPYFIKTETEIVSGTGYTVTGTSELLSVPYALNAKKAETADYNSLSNLPILFNGQYSSLSGTPTLATVATTGNYTDLSNLPALFDGQYSSLSGAPTLFDGNYNSLSNLPTLFDGQYSSLSGAPTLFDGDYNSLLNLPTLFDGQYSSLSGAPTLFDGDYNSLSNLPALFSGAYSDLTGKPALWDSTWASIKNKPTLFDGQYSSLIGAPTNVSTFTNDAGYLTTFTEVDPKVGSNTAGYSPQWNGSALVTGAIYQDATGKVGIGTTSPYQPLHLRSDITSPLGGQFAIESSAGTVDVGMVLATGGNTQWRIYQPGSTTRLDIQRGIGATMLTILSGGNVGIGTTNPTSQLHIKAAADPLQIMVENSGGNFKTGYGIKTALQEWFIGQQSLASTGFRIVDVTNLNAVRLQIETNTGNVGIGTTIPGAKLEVAGQVKITGGTPAVGAVLTSDATGLASWQAHTLSISNDTIYLTNGGFVKIPAQIPALISQDDFSGSSLKNYWTSYTTGGTTLTLSNSSATIATNFTSAIGKLYSNKQKSVTDGKLVFTAVVSTYEDNNTAYGPLARGLVNGTDRNNAIEIINISGNTVQARTVSGGVATTTNYAVGASVYNYYSYSIIATKSKVEFYLDGNLIATHTTNIPTLPLNMYFDVSSWAGNVTNTIDDAKFEIIKY